MDNLDKALHDLSKIEPSKGFISASKNRLMQRIEESHKETWFRVFLKKMDKLSISPYFVAQARTRLMNRITVFPQPVKTPLKGLTLLWNFGKKALASTLVMLIAVTSTLFFIEGKTMVEASNDSYLEIISGTASIKHSDLLVWEDINGQIEIQAGDLIKVEDKSEAMIRFFDDTELRLAENSLFLISQLAVSPTFDRQGIIEASLNQGKVWTQALNVDDGYAGFTLYTSNAVLKTLDGTFSVSTQLNAPTIIQVFNSKVEITTLIPETRQPLETIKLLTHQKAEVHMSQTKPVIVTNSLSQQDLTAAWVQNNEVRDKAHLTELREKGIDRLTQMAGTLPGHILYPIKQAKEKLELALKGNSDVSLQIEIANRRLNEALVLFEDGKEAMGRQALTAYQEMARHIAKSAMPKKQKSGTQLAYKLITPHQKTFTAELPNDTSAVLVKEALQETAEIFADTPSQLEEVRLANSIQRLQHANELVRMGDLQAAMEKLVNNQPATDRLLVEPDVESDPQRSEKILELRQEELALLRSLSTTLNQIPLHPEQSAFDTLTTMVESASNLAEATIEKTLVADNKAPEEKPVVSTVAADDIRLAELIAKIHIYRTWDGQRNQIERLLGNDFENPSSLDYLTKVRDHLEGRAYDYLNIRVLQLEQKADYQKHKAVQRKIDRAKRVREAVRQ